MARLRKKNKLRCINCTPEMGRSPGCQDSCPYYLEYRENLDKFKEKQKKELEKLRGYGETLFRDKWKVK